LLRPEPDAGRTFAGLLLFTGLLVLLGVEFFFLRDFLGGGDYYRMNTLFKFYIQVWVMLGVAAAYVLVDLWTSGGDALSSQTRWQIVLRSAWQGVLTVLILAAMVYPLMGTRTRVLDRFDHSPPIGTLDGIAYMTAGTLVWPQDNPMQLKYDYDAIRWLQENVRGTPVLAEARIGYYREGGMRVSSYTGLPTPLGGLHQNEQRWPDQVGQRDQQVMAFWTTDDPQRAWELIRELNISYIYIGQLERTFFDPDLSGVLGQWGIPSLAPDGLTKFDALLDQGRLSIAYQNERTRIYRVVSQ
jgi:uncharacterized membrane protein